VCEGLRRREKVEAVAKKSTLAEVLSGLTGVTPPLFESNRRNPPRAFDTPVAKPRRTGSRPCSSGQPAEGGLLPLNSPRRKAEIPETTPRAPRINGSTLVPRAAAYADVARIEDIRDIGLDGVCFGEFCSDETQIRHYSVGNLRKLRGPYQSLLAAWPLWAWMGWTACSPSGRRQSVTIAMQSCSRQKYPVYLDSLL